jgi:hypothetical protein
MKCIMRVAVCIATVQLFSGLMTSNADAAQLTLNFVPSASTLTWGGFFGGIPFTPVPTVPSGGADYNLALPSNTTTHQGTIVVDVDNLLAPTSIQLLSSTANADLSGKWNPQNYSFLPNDVDGDLNLYEFPDDASSSVGTVPGPPDDADYAIRINAGVDVAYAALRDIEFNVTTPAAVPVNGLGQFDSKAQNVELATGWWDYWLHPTFTNEKLRQRLEVGGGDEDNFNDFAAGTDPDSTYVAVPLGGGAYQITLTMPVNVLFPDDTAPTRYTGTLVATVTIPEPTSFVLLGMATLAALAGVRRRP